MRYVVFSLNLAFACAVLILPAQLPATAAPAEPKPGAKPAGAPLLLDDDAQQKTPERPEADNSRCFVCHLNFSFEPLATGHARAGIGCADCHGNCDKHIADESWASGGPGTPPGIMYPPERIDRACGKCHAAHDVPAREIIARWRERCPAKRDPASIVCTDCHGKHRLNPNRRRAWWNKRTGKPIKPPGATAP